MVMIISTLFVAVIYGVVAIVAAGVLPVDQVAGENLSIVAKEILSGPVYVFFMLCGAGFALISTLNSQFAWAPKPIMQACDDGWLPHGLAKLSKWNTPIILLCDWCCVYHNRFKRFYPWKYVSGCKRSYYSFD